MVEWVGLRGALPARMFALTLAPMDLLERLAKKFPAAKKTTLRRMIEAGRVLINGLPARRAKDPVADDDKVKVLDEAVRGETVKKEPVRPPFEILHEDEELVVVLKPPGLLTSTNAKEKRATVAQKLEEYFAGVNKRWRVGVIHRLDRDASGLLVFSKNTKSYHHLKAQFFHHTVDRVYTAIVKGILSPASGRIKSLLMERSDGKVMMTDDRSEGQTAITDYETLATSKVFDKHAPRGTKIPKARGADISLVKVTLLSGRKHQIRAHFAQKGAPILGDTVYGGNQIAQTRLMLAATHLAFDHPKTSQRLSFTIKPPKEIGALFPEGVGKKG